VVITAPRPLTVGVPSLRSTRLRYGVYSDESTRLNRRPVIIDCDAGQDDAINLLLAMAAPLELDILGITAVAGNVPLSLTQRNARFVCDVAGRADIPVYAGSARPLLRPLVTAEDIHGQTGLDGVRIVGPIHPLEQQHAVDFIVETLQTAEDASVTLVLTGPLTNIALAFAKSPASTLKVAEIVLMGGAMRESGNITPAAEFNIFVDPHAAEAVLACGRPITMIGLDATYQVRVTPARRDMIRAIDNAAAQLVAGLLDCGERQDLARYGGDGAPLHDPCTVALLLDRDLFTGKHCNVTVETISTLTLGHTVVDFWHVTDRASNVNWIHKVDADGMFDLLFDRLRRYGAP
jgi:purine nucleosidase